MILLHGWPSTSAMFLPVSKILSQKYHLYALDIPGFGRSSPPDEFDYSSISKTIDLFVQSKKLNKFTLLGVSLGASISLAYSSLYPHKIKKLIIHSPPVFTITNPLLKPKLKNFINQHPSTSLVLTYLAVKLRLALLVYYFDSRYQQIHKSLISFLFRDGLNTPPSTILNSLKLILFSDLRPYLSKNIPNTLLIVGDKEYPELIADSKYLLKIYPKIKYISVPNATHIMPISDHFSTQFANTILGFD